MSCIVTRLAAVVLMAMIWVGVVAAQNTPAPLQFDVVSIKLHPDGLGGAGDGFPRHGTWKWTRISLSRLVEYAYDVSQKQIGNVPGLFKGQETAFDITAKMSPDVTDIQFRQMMQSMLAERFKFAMHREVRETSVNTLEIAKGGAKLKPASGHCVQAQQSEAVEPGQNRCGEVKRSLQIKDGMLTWRFAGWSVSVKDLAAELSDDGPVIDDTAIEGVWDIDVSVIVPMLPQTDNADERSTRQFEYNRTFNDSFEKQVGLNIDRRILRKRPVEVIVVDHAELPTPN